jgi:hypothetical protein
MICSTLNAQFEFRGSTRRGESVLAASRNELSIFAHAWVGPRECPAALQEMMILMVEPTLRAQAVLQSAAPAILAEARTLAPEHRAIIQARRGFPSRVARWAQDQFATDKRATKIPTPVHKNRRSHS